MSGSGNVQDNPEWPGWRPDGDGPAAGDGEASDIRADALRARLRAVEARYRAIIAALHEGVVVQYADGTVESVNAGAERILGLTADQIAGRQARPAAWRVVREDGAPVPPEERPAAVALRTGRPQVGVTLGIHRPDGTLAWISVNAEPFIDADGRASGVVSSFFDITDMKREKAALAARADELTRVGEELRSTNSELEAFSYMVSHDLRAPFRHISGYSELLMENEQQRLSAKGKEYLRTVADSAVQAGRLVDSLLTFAHLGRSALQPADVDMNEIVADIREELRPEQGDRMIDWRRPGLPHAYADERMMRLVWRNLLSNAVKYTRPRMRAIIEVGGRDDGHEVVYWVKDNGAGFDMAYVEKLFGVFERLHSQEQFEGTGIGLAHVRRIVHRHGGRTWAEGKEGDGATFYFSIPKRA
jgi:PAS domain S-box-containing protein